MKIKKNHRRIIREERHKAELELIHIVPRDIPLHDRDLEQALERIKRGRHLHGERLG